MTARHFGASASKTFPGIPPNREYPELMNTIPFTTTGPGPSMEPPLALTPFTVWNSRAVSKSQTTRPSSAEYPRRWPSIDAENTTPGIEVTAADCAGLQPEGALGAHITGGAYQTLAPSRTASAVRPPP